jgi:hypothetical protein
MIMKNLLNTILMFAGITCVTAQNYPNGMPMHRTCGSPPPPAQWDAWFNQKVSEYVTNNASKFSVNTTMATSYTIPVIVHVIHGGQAIGTFPNISNAQVVSQINILTADFGGTGQYVSHYPTTAFNTYATAASIPSPNYNGTRIIIGNAQLTFLPCQYDKFGNAMIEPGVDRVNFNTFTLSPGYTSKDPANVAYNTQSNFPAFLNAIVKPQTIWDVTKYMNIWVTDEYNSGAPSYTGPNLLGFATFPPGTGLGGLTGGLGTSTTDGLWCWARAYGNTGFAAAPYNLGRTATHEIGHWVGLRHVWGDGAGCLTDFCNDTPPASVPNFVNQNTIATPSSAANANTVNYPYLPNNCVGSGTTATAATGVMFMNFMDYSDDNAMYMFSTDQVNRIQTAMANSPIRNVLGTHGLTIPPPIANFTFSPTSPCAGQAFTFTNTSTGSPTPPSAWSYTATGATTATANVANPVFTFTSTGTQTITLIAIANSTQVSLPITKTITIVSGITVSVAASSTAICSGASSNLTASGATSYLWNTGSTANNITVSPASTSVYTVTGTSGACSNTKTLSINVVANPTVTALGAAVCLGGTTSLTASGATSYTWNPGLLVGTSISVSPTVTTLYTILGSNGTCTSSATSNVTVNTLPVISISPATASICSGNTVTLTSSGAVSYVWSSGQTTPLVSLSPAGTTGYTVTGTASNGCTNTAVTNINVTTTPTVAANSYTICPGNSVGLLASGATNYVWNTGATTASITVTPAINTTYTVTGSNGSCVNTKTLSVTIGTGLSVIITPTNPSVCFASSATLTAGGATTYTWNTGFVGSSIVVTPSINTTYSVSGLSGTCGGTKQVTVTVNANPLTTITSTNVSCNGLCNGAILANATGAGPFTYSYSPSGPTLLCNGSYTVVTQDANGCKNNGVVTITQPAATLASTATSTNITCNGLSNGVASVNASGGTPGYTYTWSPSGINTALASGLTAGGYTVTIKDLNNCITTKSVVITQPTALIASVTGTNISCNGLFNGIANTAASGGTPIYTYTWLPSGGNAAIANSLAAGNYSVTINDGNGCNTTQTISISQPVALVVTATSTLASCPTCSDGIGSTNVTGGTGPYVYLWTPGVYTTPSVNSLSAGCYTVSVTDALNCVANNTVCINFIQTFLQNNTAALAGISLLPNPNNGEFVLNFNENSIKQIEIIDGLGRIIWTTSTNEINKQINMFEFANGIYYVKIKNDTYNVVLKMVKQ